MPEIPQISTEKSCMQIRQIFISGDFFGTLWHIFLPILRSSFRYLDHVFSLSCLKWFIFVMKSHTLKTEQYLCDVESLRPYLGHVLLKYGPCSGHVYQIFASRSLIWSQFSLNSLAGLTENQHVKPNN